jgi:rfaE bifunctional protein kinase chain/domain
VARNAKALGAKVALLSVVGTDEAGRTLQRMLESSGIDTSLLEDPGLDTTVKLRVIGRQQQLLRVDFETWPNHEVLQSKLAEFETRVTETDVVILSDYGTGGLTHITEMIRLARAAGKPVLVDPKGDDYARYSGATLLTPNRAELRQVVGKWRDDIDLAQRAERLRGELQIDALLVTRSEEGMTLFRDDGATHEPAAAREVFDVSGAGDTVIATMAVMLASGVEMVHAMRIANHAAGIVVGKLGTAVVELDELRA